MPTLRRILWRTIQAVAVLVVLLIVVIIYYSVPRTDTFYISQADFKDPTFLPKLSARLARADERELGQVRSEYPTIYAHRIASGSNTIIGYRWWSPGLVFLIDDELFEKITISIPPGGTNATIEYRIGGGNDPMVLFTAGGSA